MKKQKKEAKNTEKCAICGIMKEVGKHYATGVRVRFVCRECCARFGDWKDDVNE